MDITFGTSGWRAIIGEGFTFERVRLVTMAIAETIKQEKLHNRPIVVGYDKRFLSEHFALAAAEVLAQNGLETFLCKRDTPTPALAFAIIDQKANGGINITASHNTYEYNGIKFSSSWGGPALPEVTKIIEEKLKSLQEGLLPKERKIKHDGLYKKLIIPFDPRPDYLKHVSSLVDVQAIKKAKMTVAADMFSGTSTGYIDEILGKCVSRLEILNAERDVLFGGKSPDPNPASLENLKKTLKNIKGDVGLALDGDSDRFGIIDCEGDYISPNEFLAILVDHLVRFRKWKGVVARSVVTSHLVDAVAKKHGLNVVEVPVGFKYIGEVMMKESSVYPSKGGGFVVGGEESGGLTIRGHVPEKDGILACLLCCEIVAVQKRSLRTILKSLHKELGPVCFQRTDIRLSEDGIFAARENLSRNPPTEFAGHKTKRIVDLDGHKFIMNDGSWIACRLSGTEPVVRIYVESNTKEKLQALLDDGREWFERISI